jgi:hypothetical protein
MSLNTNFAGATLMSGKRKLQGGEHGLDALIGLVILLVEVFAGFLVLYTLYLAAVSLGSNVAAIGFGIALWGSVVVFAITTISYLIAVARGRRSWPSALWGLVLITIVLVIGYFVMAG